MNDKNDLQEKIDKFNKKSLVLKARALIAAEKFFQIEEKKRKIREQYKKGPFPTVKHIIGDIFIINDEFSIIEIITKTNKKFFQAAFKRKNYNNWEIYCRWYETFEEAILLLFSMKYEGFNGKFYIYAWRMLHHKENISEK